MKIGIISNHFSFPSINYLLNNKLIAGFAVPEIFSPGNKNIRLISESFGLPYNILSKENLSEDITFWLLDIEADIVFIFSFPYKIPGTVLEIPRYGFINFHPSILPSYRGPDPLFWQIKNGITETGITAYRLDKNIDTGPIIHIEKERIERVDTYGSLSNKLADTLLKCVTEVSAMYIENNSDLIHFIKQNESEYSYFGKPREEDLKISWQNQNAEKIYNLVRASNPKYHGAATFYNNFPMKILQISIETENNRSEKPGTVIESKTGLRIATLDKKVISIDIIYVMEGYYKGLSFKNLFNVKAGDEFGK